jgi:hypothetical protein
MPSGPMSEEHKANMRLGRQRAKAARAALREPSDDDAAGGLENPQDVLELYGDVILDRFDDDTEALIAEGLITREEVLKIREDAQVKAAAERKAATRKKLLDRFVEAERQEAGLVPEDKLRRLWLDELVDVHIVLPYLKSPNSNVVNHPDPIRIDGRRFENGRNYRVTRAQAQTLISMMALARKHHAQTLGESPAYYDANRGAYSFMGGVPRGGTPLGSTIMERRGFA